MLGLQRSKHSTLGGFFSVANQAVHCAEFWYGSSILPNNRPSSIYCSQNISLNCYSKYSQKLQNHFLGESKYSFLRTLSSWDTTGTSSKNEHSTSEITQENTSFSSQHLLMEHGDFLAVDHLKARETAKLMLCWCQNVHGGLGMPHLSLVFTVWDFKFHPRRKMLLFLSSMGSQKKNGNCQTGNPKKSSKILQIHHSAVLENHVGRWFLPFFMWHPIPLVNSRILSGSFPIWNHFLKGLLVTQSNTWHTFAV